MAWILTLDVSAADSEAATERLWALGSNGVAEVASDVDDHVRLLAGFDNETTAEAAATTTGGIVAPIDPSTWATPDVATIVVSGRELTIDAGHSFGHGAHPTTRLCLDALERHLTAGATVLDVGCGSGVLALAACALGAGRVTAIDIDPAALAATEANARTNDMVVDASLTSIEELGGAYDIVVVNMLVAELEPIAHHVSDLAGDLIIVSGALIEQRDRWSAMFPTCNVIDETIDAEWTGRVMSTND